MRQLIGTSERRLPHSGVTLIELVVTLAVLAILSIMTAPAMGEYLRNGKLRDGGHMVVTTLQFARNEAIKRNERVTLTLTGAQLLVSSAAGQPLRDERLPDAVSGSLFGPDGSVTDPPEVSFGGTGRTVPFGASFKVDLALAGAACDDGLRCPRVMVRAGGAARLCRGQEDC
jgi:prepilin-type N-terminal cleavage/methylation domain-containing protein